MKTGKQIMDTEQLTLKLKNEASNYANIYKVILILYWVLIPPYALLTVYHYTKTLAVEELVGGSAYILCFVIFILLFRRYFKEYKYVDYSQPTVQMLKMAARRYQLFQRNSIWAVFAVLLMDVGLTLDWLEEGMSFLTSQLDFGGVMLGALLAAGIIWYIRYKPLRDETLHMIKEIEQY